MEPIVTHEGLENIEKMDCVIELKKELEKIGEGSTLDVRKSSIYRLPEDVTRRHKEAYKPLVVSIGPYHNGKEQTKAMERNKLRALRRVLYRSSVPLKFYINDLEGIVDELRDAYDDLDDEWKRDTSKFLKMMILDGCFIVEILRGNLMTIYQYDDDDESERSADDHHNIFTKHGNIHMSTLVRRDMLLIENQVPLLLLETIIRYDAPNIKDGILLWLILKFCSTDDDTQLIEDGTCLHILDAYRKSLTSKLVHTPKSKRPYLDHKYLQVLRYIPPFLPKLFRYLSKRKKEKDHNQEKEVRIRHSATEMKEAGIKFKCIRKGDRIISFKRTTLWVPNLLLDAASESTFLNIMALERFHENAGNEWTTYIVFKNELIKSVSDVKLLKEEEIIYNSMGSDEDVVQLFHQLSREITMDPNNSEWYVDISSKTNSFYFSYFSILLRWKYNLMTTYFKSPWTIIAVLGATSILGLTATQTVYSILSYVNRETSALPRP